MSYLVDYYKRGLSIVPLHGIVDGRCTCGRLDCDSPGKHPRFAWKPYTITRATWPQIVSWFKEFPASNVAVVTGRISGIVVIDLDGERGLNSAREQGLSLPHTSVVRTGHGWHIYTKYPENLRVPCRLGIFPGVDIKGDGGFVVAPPSMHDSGMRYRWVRSNCDFPGFDFSSLLAKRREPDSPEGWVAEIIDGVQEGHRNSTLVRLAGRYFGMGLSEKEVLLLISSWNERNQPPLTWNEITGTVHWASQFKESDPESLARLAREIREGPYGQQ